MCRRLTPILVLLLMIPTGAFAQSPPVTDAHRQAITANPLLVVVGWFNAEYERRIDSTKTWGLSGSIAKIDDFQYRSAKALFRYYPQEDALSGFFIGGRTGVYDLAETDTEDSEFFFAAGVELGYNWLLGSERQFVISIGGGVSRLFGGDVEDALLVIPTVRLVNIGVAF